MFTISLSALNNLLPAEACDANLNTTVLNLDNRLMYRGVPNCDKGVSLRCSEV